MTCGFKVYSDRVEFTVSSTIIYVGFIKFVKKHQL